MCVFVSSFLPPILWLHLSLWRTRGTILGVHPHPRNHKPGSYPNPLFLDMTLSEMLMARQRSQHVLPKGLLSIEDTSVLSSHLELLTASALTAQSLFTAPPWPGSRSSHPNWLSSWWNVRTSMLCKNSKLHRFSVWTWWKGFFMYPGVSFA